MDLNATTGMNTTIGRMDTSTSDLGDGEDVPNLLDGTARLPQIKEDKEEGDEADKTDAEKPKDEGKDEEKEEAKPEEGKEEGKEDDGKE